MSAGDTFAEKTEVFETVHEDAYWLLNDYWQLESYLLDQICSQTLALPTT